VVTADGPVLEFIGRTNEGHTDPDSDVGLYSYLQQQLFTLNCSNSKCALAESPDQTDDFTGKTGNTNATMRLLDAQLAWFDTDNGELITLRDTKNCVVTNLWLGSPPDSTDTTGSKAGNSSRATGGSRYDYQGDYQADANDAIPTDCLWMKTASDGPYLGASDGPYLGASEGQGLPSGAAQADPSAAEKSGPGECFPATAMVWSQRGRIQMQDLRIGDKVGWNYCCCCC
jgi:hypothetical protein